jgi:hypothetical protein
MPKLVRDDDQEIVLRKSEGARWVGAVWTVVSGAGPLKALSVAEFSDTFGFLVGFTFIILPWPLLGIVMVAPAYFRICFTDRSYHLVTEWDCLRLRWEGRTGSFDDFDRICIWQYPEGYRDLGSSQPLGDRIYSVSLFWKDRRSYQLPHDERNSVDAREWAERLAARLGVRLEVVTEVPSG